MQQSSSRSQFQVWKRERAAAASVLPEEDIVLDLARLLSGSVLCVRQDLVFPGLFITRPYTHMRWKKMPTSPHREHDS